MVQGQFRAMKEALQSRTSQRISGDHSCIPWLIRHAAATINRRRKDQGGFSAYRKWKGREFNRSVAEFCECVWYLKAGSTGKDKFESRWEDGVWLGIRDRSGESIIGTPEGVVKARDFRRKGVLTERWNRDEINGFRGLPWEPIPGKEGDYEIRVKVNMPDQSQEIIRRRPDQELHRGGLGSPEKTSKSSDLQ